MPRKESTQKTLRSAITVITGIFYTNNTRVDNSFVNDSDE